MRKNARAGPEWRCARRAGGKDCFDGKSGAHFKDPSAAGERRAGGDGVTNDAAPSSLHLPPTPTNTRPRATTTTMFLLYTPDATFTLPALPSMTAILGAIPSAVAGSVGALAATEPFALLCWAAPLWALQHTLMARTRLALAFAARIPRDIVHTICSPRFTRDQAARGRGSSRSVQYACDGVHRTV